MSGAMWDLVLDIAVFSTLFVLRVVLCRLLIRIFSKYDADVTWKRAVFLVIFLDVIYMLWKTGPGYKAVLKTYLLTALCGGLIVKKTAEMELGKAVPFCLVFVLLSVVGTETSRITLNRYLPERRTVSGLFCAAVSQRLEKDTGLEEVTPKKAIGGAIQSLVAQTLSPVDSVKKTVDTVHAIRAQAALRVALADDISQNGLNASTALAARVVSDLTPAGPALADVKQKEDEPRIDAEASSDTEEAQPAPGDETLLGALTTGVSEGVAGLRSLVAGGQREAGPTAAPAAAGGPQAEREPAPEEKPAPDKKPNDLPEPTEQPAATEVLEVAGLTHAPAPPGVPPLDTPTDTRTREEILAEMSEETRQLWTTAESRIRVSGVLRGGRGGACAIANGNLVRVGGILDLVFRRMKFSFRLKSIGDGNVCSWAPIPGAPNAKKVEVLSL